MNASFAALCQRSYVGQNLLESLGLENLELEPIQFADLPIHAHCRPEGRRLDLEDACV